MSPTRIRPVSNAIMPGTEKRECAPWTAGNETPSRTRPPAVIASPIHWRRPMVSPSIRSAMIAISTIPPASTACTSDSGATAIAATWKPHATHAINIPSANSGEANNALPERSGCRKSTGTAARAPRYL